MPNFNLKSAEQSLGIEEVQSKAGYRFKNIDLLMEALTHPSYASERPDVHKQNQRLEFLGDAVLQIILSVYLYRQEEQSQEGDLTKMRSFLADEDATAEYSVRLGLNKVILLGKGENSSGGRQRPSILGDLFEAFLGAVYLDGGYEAAEKFCLGIIPPLDYVKDKLASDDNPKGRLQELVQKNRMGKIVYEVLSETGPVHSPVFEVRVVVGHREAARGSGTSRKLAERSAALQAYQTLKKENEEMNNGNGKTAKGRQGCKKILALDFDGVICDSAGETAVSGWRGAGKIWPDLFKTAYPGEAEVAAFRKVRPFLETGYQSILLTKIVQEGISMSELEARHEYHFKRIMDENSLDKGRLITMFSDIRDNWIAEDLQDWLGWHKFFPGVLEALSQALKSDYHLLIMTTKQERFVAAALESNGVSFPHEDIYGLERKLKKEILLNNQLMLKPDEIHFVEDRLETLVRVESDPSLEPVMLHYADWGYGTAGDLDAAKLDPHIDVFSLDRFNEWLKSL